MKKNSPLYIVLFMMIVTLVCGAAIAYVQSTMKETLAANARLARNRTIASAFNLTVTDQTAAAYDNILAENLTTDTLTGAGAPIEMFTTKKTPASVGFIFSGMGFWDYISGIMVLSPDLSEIRSLRIIEQKETPGLGARITEKSFTDLFADFPLRSATAGQLHFKFGEPAAENGRKIDALTGATQTSLALERIINSELDRFITAYAKSRNRNTVSGSGE